MRLYRVILVASVAACGEPRVSQDAPLVSPLVRVRLLGVAPQPPTITIVKNPEHCGVLLQDPVLLVAADNGIANCVVSIEDAPTETQKDTVDVEGAALSITASHCLFQPRVFCAKLGTRLSLVNADGIPHDPHLWGPSGRSSLHITLFDAALRPSHLLDEAGVWLLNCDIHDWMRAFVHVFAHRYYAITDESGCARLPELPTGTYRVRVWHEVLGVSSNDCLFTGDMIDIHVDFRDTRDRRRLPSGMAEWPQK